MKIIKTALPVLFVLPWLQCSQVGTTSKPAVTFSPACGKAGDSISIHVVAQGFACSNKTEFTIGNGPWTGVASAAGSGDACDLVGVVQPSFKTGKVSVLDHAASIDPGTPFSQVDFQIPCGEDAGMEASTMMPVTAIAGSFDCYSSPVDNKINCSGVASSEATAMSAVDKAFYASLREPHTLPTIAVDTCGPLTTMPPSADPTFASVGDVDVLDMGNTLFTMKPGPGPYYPYFGDAMTPGFGKVISFKFAGAPGVMPHTAVGVAIPPSFNVTTPLKPLVINKTGDTVITWDKFQADSFTIQFDSAKQACKFDPMKGQGTIPQALGASLATFGNFRFDATNVGTAGLYASGVGFQITNFVNAYYGYQVK